VPKGAGWRLRCSSLEGCRCRVGRRFREANEPICRLHGPPAQVLRLQEVIFRNEPQVLKVDEVVQHFRLRALGDAHELRELLVTESGEALRDLTIEIELPDVGVISTTGRSENLVDPKAWVKVLEGGELIDLKLVVCRRVRNQAGKRGL